jgi:drug/metabolite transporter (DMT)-like permease
MTGPIGFLLVAVGIVLVAARESLTRDIDLHWLGVALIVLGGIAIVYHVYSDHLAEPESKDE